MKLTLLLLTISMLIGILMLATMCQADDAPSSLVSDDGVKRDVLVVKIHAILDDPTTTEKEKASLADIEIKLIDLDTKLLASDQDVIKASGAKFKAATDLSNYGYLPDGVKPAPPLDAPTGAPPSGIISVSQPVFHVTGQSNSYVDFGWKVTATNGTDHATKDSLITISCRDKDDIEIAKISSDFAALPQGATTVTGSSTMKTNLWKMADHFVVTVQE